MSEPYDCGHTRLEDHDDYCGVGACYVCMQAFERDGLYPHGALMKAERTLEVTIKAHPADGPLLRVRVCGDCGMREAMPGDWAYAELVESFL